MERPEGLVAVLGFAEAKQILLGSLPSSPVIRPRPFPGVAL